MTFTYSFKSKFAAEFSRLLVEQQDKILEFTEIYEAVGFTDFKKFPGKISPSWAGNPKPGDYNYALQNDLWHYHVGYPIYSSAHTKYSTSDWVLHFQWKNKGAHIDLLDLYQHYRADGSFYLPGADYLK